MAPLALRIFRGCLGVDSSTREGYSVKKTVWHTVFSCKSVAPAKPGRMRGKAEAAVSPYNNKRPRQRSACFLSRAVVTADVRRWASTMRQLASRAHLGVGRCIAISAAFGTFGVQKYIPSYQSISHSVIVFSSLKILTWLINVIITSAVCSSTGIRYCFVSLYTRLAIRHFVNVSLKRISTVKK